MSQSQHVVNLSGQCRNFFQLFGLESEFEIDLEDLAKRYRVLQQQFHPDFHSGGSATDQRLAAQVSAEVNAGYQILKDPVRRAGFMLECRGVNLRDLELQPIAGSFLLAQMELREAVQELDAHDVEAKQILIEEAEALFQHELDDFRTSMADDELERAGTAWVHLLYIDKLQREIDSACVL